MLQKHIQDLWITVLHLSQTRKFFPEMITGHFGYFPFIYLGNYLCIFISVYVQSLKVTVLVQTDARECLVDETCRNLLGGDCTSSQASLDIR